MEDKHDEYRKRMLDIESRSVDKDGKLSKNKVVNLKEVLSHGSDDFDEDIEEAPQDTNCLTVGEKLPEVPSLIFNENNFDIEEHESDLELSPVEVNIKRKSSLKIKKKIVNEESEQEQDKHVVFADFCGVTLTDVRELQNDDEPPKIPRTVLKYLPNAKIKKLRATNDSGDPNFIAGCKMKLLFEQPGINWRFKDLVSEGSIKLESCVDCEDKWTVSGIVAVTPFISCSKVFVRTTTDAWKSWHDYDCAPMDESEDMTMNILGYRRFVFTVVISQDLFSNSPLDQDHTVRFASDECSPPPDNKPSIKLEFAVACNSDANTHWDNNNGCNYAVDISLSS